jgi:excisionase family DNA binding protein
VGRGRGGAHLSERRILDLDPAALVAALAELPDAELRPLAERLQELLVASSAPTRPVAPMPTYIDTAEAARRLSCSPKTIRAMIDRGELQAVRLGAKGPWRVDLTSIEAVGGGESGPAPVARRQPRRRASTGEFGRRAAGPEAP